MRRNLGWVAIIAGIIAALLPVNARLLGTDVGCGPALIALSRKGDVGALCHNAALSYVLIAGVLFIVGCAALGGADPLPGSAGGKRTGAGHQGYTVPAVVIVLCSALLVVALLRG